MPHFNRLPLQAVAAALLFSGVPVATFMEPALAQIGIGVSITVPIAPPVLPVYAQPVIPGPGYIWTPGYWGWNGTGYYWVPGTWVLPPRVGVLWTPGYWGWSNGAYVFNAGYWGPTVGFYGGINYGFGYGGVGFAGGHWSNGAFAYNTAVTNVGATHIGNTYNAPVNINRTTNITNNVSYNGGQGGTTAAPTAAQKTYASQEHIAPTAAQIQHEQKASTNPALSYAHNKGVPPIGATARPGAFQGTGVTRAKATAPLAEHANLNQGAGPSPAAKLQPAANGAAPHGGQNNPRPEKTAVRQLGPGSGPGGGPRPGRPGPGAFPGAGPHPGPQFAARPHPGPISLPDLTRGRILDQAQGVYDCKLFLNETAAESPRRPLFESARPLAGEIQNQLVPQL